MSASTGSRKTAISPLGRVSGRRKAEASAGESVSALNAEMAIENAIVNENCLYRIPVVPGNKLTGTKTEISTSEVAITALVTSAMAMMVALCGSCTHSSVPATVCPSRWRCTFSITTIASSTTSPVASVIPKSVSELMEKSKSRMKANVPISETGIVMAGMMVARQSCKNRKITRITMTDGRGQRLLHLHDGVVHHGGRVHRDKPLQPRRERLLQLGQHRLAARVHIDGVGVGELLHAEADRIAAGVFQPRPVALRAQLRAPNVLQQHDAVAVGRRSRGSVALRT